MRGGRNKKSLQQHIEDGTYRADRHGKISISDEQTLQEMKNDLYTDYIEIRKELKKVDKTKDLERYEKLNKIRIEYLKAFHILNKTPVGDEPKIEDNPDGFKTI
jgi:hypothetical protein